MSAEENKQKIVDYCSQYVLSNDQLKKFQEAYLIEIKRGLSKETHNTAVVKCHITYVTDLPDGTETGKYLGLDLGGTNFRVLLVDLFGDGKFEIKSKIYILPPNLLTDAGDKLFDRIVESLDDFVTVYNLRTEKLSMGFTFSFPCEQLGLQNGILTRWTKGFNCSDVVGKNVVDLLNQALTRNSTINIKTIALLNDTTGTLMSCALEYNNCRIGLIVGTGMNACYMENVSEVENWDPSISDAKYVIINTEQGAFGENGCIDFLRTEEDKYIDTKSINAGMQFFEKMVSGMYMGELVRLIMIKLVKEKALFDGNSSDVLEEYDSFKTAYVSEIESDKDFANCKRIVKELRLDKHAKQEDYENVLYICQCVSKRSAHLVSASLSSLLDKMGETNVVIGVDGSVYRLHPHYHTLMEEKIRELTKPEITFKIVLSDDGSGKGAAVIAAVVANGGKPKNCSAKICPGKGTAPKN